MQVQNTHTHTGEGEEKKHKKSEMKKHKKKKKKKTMIAKRFLCLFCKIKSNVLVLWGEICFVCRIRHTCVCLDTIPYIPHTYTIYPAPCHRMQSISIEWEREQRERERGEKRSEAVCDRQSTAEKKRKMQCNLHELAYTLSLRCCGSKKTKKKKI